MEGEALCRQGRPSIPQRPLLLLNFGRVQGPSHLCLLWRSTDLRALRREERTRKPGDPLQVDAQGFLLLRKAGEIQGETEGRRTAADLVKGTAWRMISDWLHYVSYGL